MDRTTVLLILSRRSLERARALAGRATTAFKLAVSMQIVLRVFIEEGLKRPENPELLRNIERQAHAVREVRAAARRPARRAVTLPRKMKEPTE